MLLIDRLSLAAVEPAPAEAGEDACERRQGDDDVVGIALCEHSRKSFRVIDSPGLSRRPGVRVGHPPTGDPPRPIRAAPRTSEQRRAYANSTRTSTGAALRRSTA